VFAASGSGSHLFCPDSLPSSKYRGNGLQRIVHPTAGVRTRGRWGSACCGRRKCNRELSNNGGCDVYDAAAAVTVATTDAASPQAAAADAGTADAAAATLVGGVRPTCRLTTRAARTGTIDEDGASRCGKQQGPKIGKPRTLYFTRSRWWGHCIPIDTSEKEAPGKAGRRLFCSQNHLYQALDALVDNRSLFTIPSHIDFSRLLAPDLGRGHVAGLGRRRPRGKHGAESSTG